MIVFYGKMSRKKSPVFCNFLHKNHIIQYIGQIEGDSPQQKNVREAATVRMFLWR